MKKSTADESWFAYGSSASTLSKLSVCISHSRAPWKVMLQGTKEARQAFWSLLFSSLGGLNNVFGNWLVIL